MTVLRELSYTIEEQTDGLRANPRGLSQTELADMMRRLRSRTCRNAAEREVFDLVCSAVKFRANNHAKAQARTPHVLKVVQLANAERFAETCIWRALTLIRKGVA